MPVHANILDLGSMTAFEVDALDRARTTIFLVVSPIEEHGPHLPLATDVIEAEGVARRLAARLATERPADRFLFYPTIPLGADSFHFAGSASVRPGVIAALVEDVCTSLAEGGFTRFIVSSHHGAPSHNLAFERAAIRVRRRTRGRARLLALSGRTIVDLYFGGGLEAHFAHMKDGESAKDALRLDCHAGAFETSELLALRPDLVREGWKDLPPVLVPLEKLTRESGRREAAGKGYFGAPGISSVERGEAYLDMLVERAMPDVRAFLDGKDVPGLALRWRLALSALSTIADWKDRLASWTGRRKKHARPSV